MATSCKLAEAATVVPLPIIPMARFRRLMLYEGWAVDLARLCVDIPYAHECLALAHTSGDAALRQAAMQLFATYERNPNHSPLH